MPVKTIPRCDLLSAEVPTVAKNLSVIIDKAPREATHLHILNDDLKTKVLAVEERSGKKAQLKLTQTPAMADSGRDGFYNQMLQFVKGCRFSPRPDEPEAAEQIYELLVQHNTGLANLSYDIESHHINALLLDLKKADFQESIRVLSLESVISDLETAQSTFEFIKSSKIEQTAASDLPQFETVIAPIRTVLFEILTHLGSLERLEPSTYATVVNETNELITEVASKVKGRKTRKNNTETQASPVL